MRAKVRLALNGGLLNLPKGLPFELRWEEEEVRGVLRLQNPVLGEVALPFASRLEGTRLLALDLPPPSLRVEGLVRPGRDELELDLELVLPKGRSWGERAFARILEFLFYKGLERTLSQVASSPV